MPQTLNLYEPTPGGRSVVDRFIKKDLKNRPDVADAVVDHLKILVQTPIATLREQRVIEHVRGDLFASRLRTKDHWVRLLIAFFPSDVDIIVLLPVLKQQNKLDPDDIDQASDNLREYTQRLSLKKSTKERHQ